MYGGHRPGANLFSSTIICVRADTGERVWHFQTVHHDIFDYDNPTPPILANITVNDRPIKALVQLTKQGNAFVLDRVTGEPVWPIEERPVPESSVPGEWTAPTQPFPTRPAPYEQNGITVDDLIDFTPELRTEAVEIAKQVRHGADLHSPVTRRRGPERDEGHVTGAGSCGWYQLGRRGARSGDRDALRTVENGSVLRPAGSRRRRSYRPALSRDSRARRRSPRAAPD